MPPSMVRAALRYLVSACPQGSALLSKSVKKQFIELDLALPKPDQLYPNDLEADGKSQVLDDFLALTRYLPLSLTDTSLVGLLALKWHTLSRCQSTIFMPCSARMPALLDTPLQQRARIRLEMGKRLQDCKHTGWHFGRRSVAAAIKACMLDVKLNLPFHLKLFKRFNP